MPGIRSHFRYFCSWNVEDHMSNSHISHLLLLLLVGLILIGSVNMACEISDLRELFVKYRSDKSLDITVSLTDPNSLSNNSQTERSVLR